MRAFLHVRGLSGTGRVIDAVTDWLLPPPRCQPKNGASVLTTRTYSMKIWCAWNFTVCSWRGRRFDVDIYFLWNLHETRVLRCSQLPNGFGRISSLSVDNSSSMRFHHHLIVDIAYSASGDDDCFAASIRTAVKILWHSLNLELCRSNIAIF